MGPDEAPARPDRDAGPRQAMGAEEPSLTRPRSDMDRRLLLTSQDYGLAWAA